MRRNQWFMSVVLTLWLVMARPSDIARMNDDGREGAHTALPSRSTKFQSLACQRNQREVCHL
jgi:hypothetical protein